MHVSKAEHSLREWIRKRNSFTQSFLKEPVMTFCVSLPELRLTLAATEITEIIFPHHTAAGQGCHEPGGFSRCPACCSQDPWWDAPSHSLCQAWGVCSALLSLFLSTLISALLHSPQRRGILLTQFLLFQPEAVAEEPHLQCFHPSLLFSSQWDGAHGIPVAPRGCCWSQLPG